MGPIAGPFARSRTLPGNSLPSGFRPPAYEEITVWYRQRRPYNLPLQYQMEKQIKDVDVTIPPGGYTVLNPPVPTNQMRNLANNKAYSNFREAVGKQSQWATNLIEAGKTISSMENSLWKLAHAASALRRGRFGDFLAYLGVSRVNRKPIRRHQFAGTWLEYHFGWEPLVQDIGAGMDALTQDFSSRKAKGRGSYNEFRPFSSVVTGSGGTSWIRENTWYTVKAQIMAEVRVVNPNLNLLDQMGFINPLAVAWEAVPFSFVVDWFGNVGQCLSSVTDFVGVELSNSTSTIFSTTMRENFESSLYPANPGLNNSRHAIQRRINVDRNLGFTGPTLELKPFKGFSVTRGATAVALLLQMLKG